MEFIMQTNLTEALPKSIDFNFEALKSELTERLEKYQNLVVTEDDIPEAKEDRAKLNKLKDALDTRRKSVKKEILAPYTEFEAKVKELIGLIEQPILAIDTQLNAYEEIRKNEKMEEVTEAYESIVPAELKSIIPLDKIMKPQWLNKTTNLKKVNEELEVLYKRTNADMMVIDTIEEEYRPAVLGRYTATLDIAAAMAYRAELKKSAEAWKSIEEATGYTKEEKTKPEPVSETQNTETVHVLRLEFQLTKTEASALKEFLVKNNITFRRIEGGLNNG